MKELFNPKNVEKATNIKKQIDKDDERFKNVKLYNYGSKTGDKTNGFIDSIVNLFFK